MRKTNAATELEVLKLIVLGESYSTIAVQTGVPVPTLKKIKQRNLDKIKKLKVRALETQAQQIGSIIVRSNAMIKAQLDKSERDEEGLSILVDQYRNGELSRGEYYKRKRALKPLTIRELLSISEAMHQQVNLEQKLLDARTTGLTSHLSKMH